MKTAFVALAVLALASSGANPALPHHPRAPMPIMSFVFLPAYAANSWGCYRCDTNIDDNPQNPLKYNDCSNEKSDYYGDWETCTSEPTLFEDFTCYKRYGENGSLLSCQLGF